MDVGENTSRQYRQANLNYMSVESTLPNSRGTVNSILKEPKTFSHVDQTMTPVGSGHLLPVPDTVKI